MKTRLLIIGIVMGVLLFSTNTFAYAEDDFFSTLFGDAATNKDDDDYDDNGWFYGWGITSVDDDGNVYVADMTKNRIQKFSTDGKFLLKWGNAGTNDGEFSGPVKIVFDSMGNILVSDPDNDRIQKFTSTGEFLTKFDNFQESDKKYTTIHGNIAIDSKDYVYSLDTQNLRVHKISPDGEIAVSWYLYPEKESPKISRPHILSIDSSDNVYVADSHHIHRFSPDGKIISKFDTSKMDTGETPDAISLVMDFSGNSFVRNYDSGKIAKFSPNGVEISSQVFASLTTEDPNRFAVWPTLDKEDNLYAFDVLDFNVKKFDRDGNTVASFGERAKEPIEYNQITNPESIAVDSKDNVYVESENRIFRFAGDGSAHGKLKLVSEDGKAVTQITNIVFDSSDNMHVSTEHNRIVKFTNEGQFIEEYDLTQTAAGYYRLDSMRMSIDSSSNIYTVGRVASNDDNDILKFSSDGKLIASWSHDNDVSGYDSSTRIPTAIVADHDGNVYVAYYTSLIRKFSPDGEFIGEWKSPQKDVQFLDIYAMAVDSENNVYVGNGNPHKIIKFSPDGKFMAEWGTIGNEEGQFFQIAGIAIDSKDNVYVADMGNKRIQKFSKGFIISEYTDISDLNIKNTLSEKNSPEQLSMPEYVFPLKQFESGVQIDEIQCRDNLQLVERSNGKPACVSSDTVCILDERDLINGKRISEHMALFCST